MPNGTFFDVGAAPLAPGLRSVQWKIPAAMIEEADA
jgi:hypothetical protein